jgi:hypothetical protein
MPVSSVRRVNCPCPTSPPSGAVILEKFFAAAVRTAAVVVPSGGGKYRRGVLRPSCAKHRQNHTVARSKRRNCFNYTNLCYYFSCYQYLSISKNINLFFFCSKFVNKIPFLLSNMKLQNTVLSKSFEKKISIKIKNISKKSLKSKS